MKLLDANIIIRFLLKDQQKQFIAASNLLKDFEQDLLLTDVTVAEVCWLLTSHYKFSKEEAAQKIYSILNFPNIQSNKSILIRSLYFFRNFNIDYIDAYLAAYAEKENLEGVYSFDKDLDKIKEIRRFEPK